MSTTPCLTTGRSSCEPLTSTLANGDPTQTGTDFLPGLGSVHVAVVFTRAQIEALVVHARLLLMRLGYA